MEVLGARLGKAPWRYDFTCFNDQVKAKVARDFKTSTSILKTYLQEIPKIQWDFDDGNREFAGSSGFL